MRLNRILDIMVSYDSDMLHKNTNGHTYYGFHNGSVSICKKEKDEFYYILDKDGTVSKLKKGDVEVIDTFSAAKLPDVEYELYGDIAVVSAGYIMFNSKDKAFDKKLITSLWDYYNENRDKFKSSLFVTFSKEYLKQATISSSTSSLQIELLTVPELAKMNCDFKYFEKRIFPFIKSMNNRNSIYIYTTQISLEYLSRTPDKEVSEMGVDAIINRAEQLFPSVEFTYKPVTVRKLYY